MQKLLTFLSAKIVVFLHLERLKFNFSLTNDVVSFEQLGPDCYLNFVPSD